MSKAKATAPIKKVEQKKEIVKPVEQVEPVEQVDQVEQEKPVEEVQDIEDIQDKLEKEIPEPETETDEVDEDLITKEEDFETFNHECPDGSIFDREDLALDWCKMRKMNIGEIKKVKK